MGRRKLRLADEEFLRPTKGPLKTTTKTDWRRTLLNLKENKVYRFSTQYGDEYSRILSMAYTLRREYEADFIVNTIHQDNWGVYVKRIPL